MIDVNWNLAPEGAVALKQDVGRWKNVTWIHADGSWWDDTDATWNSGSAERDWLQTIAVRPVTQTKTVADVWEEFGGEWPEDEPDDFVCIWDSRDNEFIFWCSNYEPVSYCYNVCTREQFEAYVKEQEGEKWTHRDTDGEPCNILIDAPDSLGRVIILRRNGWYMPVDRANLKPIKPTISKSEAWDLCQDYDGTKGMIKYMLRPARDLQHNLTHPTTYQAPSC